MTFRCVPSKSLQLLSWPLENFKLALQWLAADRTIRLGKSNIANHQSGQLLDGWLVGKVG